jgi:signal transduction histidine kinase
VKAFFGSMTGRVFVTLFLGILLSAALTQLLADMERQRVLEEYRDLHTLERAEQLIMATEIVPSSARHTYLGIANRPGVLLETAASEGRALPARTKFADGLAGRMGKAYQIASLAERPAICDMPHQQTVLYGLMRVQWRGACEMLSVTMRDGEHLRLSILPPVFATEPPKTDFRAVLALFILSIATLAYLVARMTTSPLKKLAQAAKNLGHDINHPPLQLTGVSEIRQASAAFNAMQARIRQYIAQRTEMLAAITHDLQTPLTRLRLRLEKVSDADLQQRLIGDLSAMQEMVREGLDLARSTDTNETMQALDLDSLLDSVCADATDAGQDVVLQGRVAMRAFGRPMGLRRCLVNLIDNAVKYGHNAHVTVERTKGAARIRIRDSGPGIDAAELARVFEPFYRVESSRSRESGGTGLGLTIARNIAEQHGGTIALANHPEGGLEVTLMLPEYYAGK